MNMKAPPQMAPTKVNFATSAGVGRLMAGNIDAV
jgi:hypothetical protein